MFLEVAIVIVGFYLGMKLEGDFNLSKKIV